MKENKQLKVLKCHHHVKVLSRRQCNSRVLYTLHWKSNTGLILDIVCIFHFIEHAFGCNRGLNLIRKSKINNAVIIEQFWKIRWSAFLYIYIKIIFYFNFIQWIFFSIVTDLTVIKLPYLIVARCTIKDFFSFNRDMQCVRKKSIEFTQCWLIIYFASQIEATTCIMR